MSYVLIYVRHNRMNSSSLKLIINATEDFIVDIPLIWQYIGEIIGAFIGASASNIAILKPILKNTPSAKSAQFFADVIRYATEFSVWNDERSIE
jgi:uncharacterized membrane protein